MLSRGSKFEAKVSKCVYDGMEGGDPNLVTWFVRLIYLYAMALNSFLSASYQWRGGRGGRGKYNFLKPM